VHTDKHQLERRSAILRLLRESPCGRQADLARLLRKEGVEATQSSISRDLRELGVIKARGRYLPPDEPAPDAANFGALAPFVVSVTPAGPSNTVIRTTVGTAQSVAVAVDRSRWPEVIGTLSGDDTIFIATADAKSQSALISRLRQLFSR